MLPMATTTASPASSARTKRETGKFTRYASSRTTTAPPPPCTARGSTNASTSSRLERSFLTRRLSTGSRPGERRRGLLRGEPVQVEVVLNHPVRALELPQDVARQSRAQVGRVVLDLGVVVEGEARELGEDGLLVLAPLGGNRRRGNAVRLDAIGRRDRRHVAHRLAKHVISRLMPRASRLCHPRFSRYLSASSAAMHPVPALVTAWRYT